MSPVNTVVNLPSWLALELPLENLKCGDKLAGFH